MYGTSAHSVFATEFLYLSVCLSVCLPLCSCLTVYVRCITVSNLVYAMPKNPNNVSPQNLNFLTRTETHIFRADTILFISLSLRFNGHFPGEPGLAGVY